MKIDQIKAQQNKKKIAENKQKKEMNKTLQGVLVDNHLKNQNGQSLSFDDIQDTLLICEKKETPIKGIEEKKESNFDIDKAILPILVGSIAIIGGCLGLSAILKQASKTLINTKNFEHLPDLAINMNIKQEPQFAIYRAIRGPNFKNIFGAIAVFMMSGITIACKNFVDGAKEVWLKKQSADIEKNLQENLIEVETQAFSGKLNVVNEILNENVRLFDSTINKQEKKESEIFAGFLSFKGDCSEKQEENVFEKNKKNIKYACLIGGVTLGAILAGKMSLSNLKKTMTFSNEFANNYTEKTISAIEEITQKGNKKDIPTITELLKSICAKPEYITEIGGKYNLQEDEIKGIISAVEESKKTIFADAPTALGGIPKKVQYYCYIDEDRGHLYNWILNPENKFTKYLFTAFTISSAIGYLFKQGMDALKELTVMKENAKTELDLRKRLVSVEIENFKSKKESAITPLVENFKKQAETGKKSKEELKQLADNILMETKNGPPYVYA